ncbi:hypothetical protein PF005_g31241 [Phytophthora fragariae]|uniref:Secreted protein n=1 Tax=Phytophthora fragariae TaxID=53985 RepID=A0A6A4AWL7_9STRA|nr:hypothetical protein PF003_g2846 [Phytophthora fragariae]KAE8918358.1 hypothetical protein PF009_g31327 [Phytophthora fragariae]KAE8959818.1 hypothetical protein PF011_g30311 [Phytophthora fragariae]KAE9059284.1 hypothetical protein PF010_g30680 [Phytophthora fragariae]KAE9060041.1 hypothetical protein PF007_g30743 [Phytophthora fragariae]
MYCFKCSSLLIHVLIQYIPPSTVLTSDHEAGHLATIIAFFRCAVGNSVNTTNTRFQNVCCKFDTSA